MTGIKIFTLLFIFFIVAGVVLLTLGTIPAQNTIDGDKLTTRFMLGNKSTVNIKGVEFKEVPEDAKHNIIRTFGTSLGKKHSGSFMNTKTKTHYTFLLTGKGKQYFFQKGKENYVIDMGLQELLSTFNEEEY